MSNTSFNGWPLLSGHPSTTFQAVNGKTVYVANRDVAILFDYIQFNWHRYITRLGPATANQRPGERTGQIVIHSYRPGDPGNTGGRSNHRSATAMDINGHLHHYEPQCKDPDFWCGGSGLVYHPGMSTTVQNRLRSITYRVKDNSGRSVMTPGVDFVLGKRDAMHVEIANGVSSARVKQAAQRILPLSVRDWLPTPTDVGNFQLKQGLEIDCIAGPITQARLNQVIDQINTRLARIEGKVDTAISEARAAKTNSAKTNTTLSGHTTRLNNLRTLLQKTPADTVAALLGRLSPHTGKNMDWNIRLGLLTGNKKHPMHPYDFDSPAHAWYRTWEVVENMAKAIEKIVPGFKMPEDTKKSDGEEYEWRK